MPIHKTCAFSKAPIEEDKEIVMVYLSSETIRFNNAEIKVPFSSSDYTYAWDNFKIIGFPIMGTFIGHSKVEYECLDSEKILLSVINEGSVTQYSSLDDLNQDIIRNDFKATDKSKNKFVTSFMILRSVFELLISEKREREMVEGLFMIPEKHEESTISYSESLIENEYNLSNLKTKNILLLNDDVEDEKDSYDTEKEKLRMLRYVLKNHFSRNLIYTGKSLFDIALETPEKGSLIGKHLTNLYWVAFSFDRYRMPLAPTLHSYENRNHFEIASLYRKLANLIEKESINTDTEVPFYPIR